VVPRSEPTAWLARGTWRPQRCRRLRRPRGGVANTLHNTSFSEVLCLVIRDQVHCEGLERRSMSEGFIPRTASRVQRYLVSDRLCRKRT